MAHEKAVPRSKVSSLSGQWLPVLATDHFSCSDWLSRTSVKPSVKLQSSALSHVHTWKSFLDLFQWAKRNQSAYPVLSFMSFAIQFHVILPLMAPFFHLHPAPRSTNPRIVSFIPPGCFFPPARQMNTRQPDGSTNCIINYSNSLLRSLPQPPVTYEGYIHLLAWYTRPEPTGFCKLKPVPQTPNPVRILLGCYMISWTSTCVSLPEAQL